MKKYKSIVYWSEEDKCYLAEIPLLPGCIADGETKEEAIQNVNVIADEWIETANDIKREIPKPLQEFESTSPSIEDVAKYVLQKTNNITTKKLEKLVYYCQAWTLGWFKEELFPQEFQAWAYGPVCPSLFYHHRGNYIANPMMFSRIGEHEFSFSEKMMIDLVLKVYGDKDADFLSNLTHLEPPWNKARKGLSEEEKSNRIIEKDWMIDFYSQGQD